MDFSQASLSFFTPIGLWIPLPPPNTFAKRALKAALASSRLIEARETVVTGGGSAGVPVGPVFAGSGGFGVSGIFAGSEPGGAAQPVGRPAGSRPETGGVSGGFGVEGALPASGGVSPGFSAWTGGWPVSSLFVHPAQPDPTRQNAAKIPSPIPPRRSTRIRPLLFRSGMNLADMPRVRTF